jgi:hypothetical protein
MTWFFQLSGDESDLNSLAESFTQSQPSIVLDDGEYFLVIADGTFYEEPRAVLQRAQQLVETINGGARLVLGAREPLRIGRVFRRRPDGKRDFFVFPEPGMFHFRGFAPTITITRSDGTVEVSRPADPITEWTLLAAGDEAASKVLRLVGTLPLDWVNLYKIFEIICSDVGGPDAVASNGWSTKRSISLFRQTANSPGALGFAARHGTESTKPPNKPMTIAEARSLIESIIHQWLRSKI